MTGHWWADSPRNHRRFQICFCPAWHSHFWAGLSSFSRPWLHTPGIGRRWENIPQALISISIAGPVPLSSATSLPSRVWGICQDGTTGQYLQTTNRGAHRTATFRSVLWVGKARKLFIASSRNKEGTCWQASRQLTGQCGDAGLALTWEWGWLVGVKGPKRRQEAETGGAGRFLGAGSNSGGGRGRWAIEQTAGVGMRRRKAQGRLGVTKCCAFSLANLLLPCLPREP